MYTDSILIPEKSFVRYRSSLGWRCFLEFHVIVVLDIRLKSLLELLDRKLIRGSLECARCLGWDQDARDNLDDTVLGDAVHHGDVVEAVDSHINPTTKSDDVDAQRLSSEACLEVNMEAALRDASLSLWWIVGVGVKGEVVSGMVEDQGFQVLLAVFAEEECVDSGSKLLECAVRWCEKSSTDMARCVIERGE